MTKEMNKIKSDTNVSKSNIYEKINEMKKEIREHNFIMDKILPSNLGSSEYASIGQYYSLLRDLTIKYNLFFKWDVTEILNFEKNAFQISGKVPQHLSTVFCVATFVNIDNTEEVVEYTSIASGTDMADKGVSIASTMAFRNWFDKNFTPSYLNEGGEEEISETTEKTEEPKVPTYVPQEKKEEIIKEVVKETQPEDKDSDEVKAIIDNIMKVRELLGNPEWGGPTLAKLMNGEIDSVGLMEVELKVNNKLDSLMEAK